MDAAEHWYQLALEINPDIADAWFGLGQIRLAQQRPSDAVVCIERALALQPTADDGYRYALGLALEKSGQPRRALDFYRAELRLHPSQLAAQRAIARLQRTLQQ